MKKNVIKEKVQAAKVLLEEIETLLQEPCECKSEQPVVPQGEAEKEPTTYSLDDVRAVLAKAMVGGKKTEVRELLERHGAEKLSELHESKYGEVIHEVEGW